MIASVLHKKLKEDLKPLNGVSKSQVGVLDSELSWGHGSKFSTRGSNMMLVV